MRAVVLRDGRLEVRETPDPVPGEGELLLRTLATAICASDVHFMDHHDAVPAGGPAGMVSTLIGTSCSATSSSVS
jgi:threonine dehydrogenase-like Zn-dependent dehydrogenase